MSEQVVAEKIETLKETISFSLRSIFLVILPSSMGLFLLSQPIVRVFFQRGKFDIHSTYITSYALIFYSLGLTFFSAVKLLSSAFFSLKDTSTPVKTTAFCLIINIILNYILMWPLRIGGLALASSISAGLNFILLFCLLEKRIGKLNRKMILYSFLKILLATLIMGIFVSIFWKNLFLNLAEYLRVILVMIFAILVFILSCILLKVEELEILRSAWSLKKK